MDIPELSNEQRRQLIDAQQLYASWRPLTVEQNSRHTLYWNTSKGIRYLYSIRNGVRTPMGRETPELVDQKARHDARGQRLQQLLKPLGERLDQMAPVNRAMRIGRLPTLPARILRKLDDLNLLGDDIIVAGTNALYAYEAAAGLLVGGDFLATTDADLVWDSRRTLELASAKIGHQGLMGLLREIDDSFEAHYGFNATNSKGYIVDLIMPEGDNLPSRLVSGADIEATPMEGIQWLLDAPRFEQVVVAEDGYPLRIFVPDPRTFALHKLWLSRRDTRQALKRPRDEAQARLVAHIAAKYLALPMDPGAMPWLPADLAKLANDLR